MTLKAAIVINSQPLPHLTPWLVGEVGAMRAAPVHMHVIQTAAATTVFE